MYTFLTSFRQFVYREGVIPLRLLRLRHSHVKQNITYSCDGGVDGFMNMQLQGMNGGVIRYDDKTVRVVSQVRILTIIFCVLCQGNTTSVNSASTLLPIT